MKKFALLLVLIITLSFISCNTSKNYNNTSNATVDSEELKKSIDELKKIETKTFSTFDFDSLTTKKVKEITEDDEKDFEITTKNKNSYTVYITDTGTKYHKKSCSYLRKTCIKIDRNEAIGEGYRPCSRCNP